MRAFVKAFASLVSKAPWAVVITTLVLFGVFGSLSTQVEIGQGNEGLSPDHAECLPPTDQGLVRSGFPGGHPASIVRNEEETSSQGGLIETVTANSTPPRERSPV